jgi:hypothetical protein
MHVTKLVTHPILSVEIQKRKGPGDDGTETRNTGLLFTLLLNLSALH